jgi:transcription termination factor Rho
MNLTELKTKTMPELVEIAQSMGLDNIARSRKQDCIFSILKRHAKSGEDIFGQGVLEILQDGFGFLRSADASYLAGPMIFMCHPVRFVGLACAPVIASMARFAHPKMVNGTLPCLK